MTHFYTERVVNTVLLTYNGDTNTWVGRTATGGAAVFDEEVGNVAWTATTPGGEQQTFFYLGDAVAWVESKGYRLERATANAYAMKDIQNGAVGWTLRDSETNESLGFVPSGTGPAMVVDLYPYKNLAVIDPSYSSGRVGVRILSKV